LSRPTNTALAPATDLAPRIRLVPQWLLRRPPSAYARRSGSIPSRADWAYEVKWAHAIVSAQWGLPDLFSSTFGASGAASLHQRLLTLACECL
jgi:hypothetical protein